jgi:hypothetical protein
MKPTAAQRLDVARHLRYELRMLWDSGNALAGLHSQTISNALVESFALHARNLIDFYYATPQQDDVVAEHFFSDPAAWARVRPTKTTTLDGAKTRANKEVSHLTYTRLSVSADKKGWPTDEIIRDLDAVLRVFCTEADLLPEDVQVFRYRELLP